MDQERTVEGEGFIVLLDGQRFPVSYRLSAQSGGKFPEYTGVIRGTEIAIGLAARVESYFSLQMSDGRRIEGRLEDAKPSAREANFVSTSSIHNPTKAGQP